MPASLSHQDANDLADAVARGRLCMAEVADISVTELNTLFEVGARRLDQGALAEAVDIMASVIMLFPYAAKFWRGYAVCLQRAGAWAQAAAAYRAALLLEPGHGLAECYLGEVLIQAGDRGGLGYLQAAARSDHPIACGRAKVLLRALQVEDEQAELAVPEPPPAPSPAEEVTAPLFSLADGQPLPVPASRFDAADAQHIPKVDASGVADKIFVPTPQENTGTHTAVVARGVPTRLREESQASVTAVVDRRPKVTLPAVPTAWWKRKRGLPLTEEIMLTDVEEEKP